MPQSLRRETNCEKLSNKFQHRRRTRTVKEGEIITAVTGEVLAKLVLALTVLVHTEELTLGVKETANLGMEERVSMPVKETAKLDVKERAVVSVHLILNATIATCSVILPIPTVHGHCSVAKIRVVNLAA